VTDWSRVQRATIRVRQHYRYTYSSPVWDLKQRLIMVPPDQQAGQRLLGWDMDVRGTEGDHRVTWERDQFGNRVGRVIANRVPRAVDFETTFRIERTRDRDSVREPAPWRDVKGRLAYLYPTALTSPDPRLRDAAQAIAQAARAPRERTERACDWARTAITYQFGVTGYTTPAAMALHLGKGVCQDYAHILLTVLRLLDVPARYVSGHLIGEGAPHAWVEALLPSSEGMVEVFGYDPTHSRRTRLDYVTVAVGRDFADISPTSGVYGGPALGRLAASKQAEVLELVSDEPAAVG
jgi:transglutaminase-like putative cysteine protease